MIQDLYYATREKDLHDADDTHARLESPLTSRNHIDAFATALYTNKNRTEFEHKFTLVIKIDDRDTGNKITQ